MVGRNSHRSSTAQGGLKGEWELAGWATVGKVPQVEGIASAKAQTCVLECLSSPWVLEHQVGQQ